jgi:hypothetical protein
MPSLTKKMFRNQDFIEKPPFPVVGGAVALIVAVNVASTVATLLAL